MNEQITVCQCHMCTQARLSQLERAALQPETDSQAAKDARRMVAVEKVKHLIEDFYGNAWTGADEIEAFIKEAQG